jgi:hypothetical protein
MTKELGAIFLVGTSILAASSAFRPALESIQSSGWVQRPFLRGLIDWDVKLATRAPTKTEVKMPEAVLPFRHMPSRRGM